MLIDVKRNYGSGKLEGLAEDIRTEGRAGKELSRHGWIEVRAGLSESTLRKKVGDPEV